jgi:hypothetical protein
MNMQERIRDAQERHSQASEERLRLTEEARATIAWLQQKRQEARDLLERLREIRQEIQQREKQ